MTDDGRAQTEDFCFICGLNEEGHDAYHERWGDRHPFCPPPKGNPPSAPRPTSAERDAEWRAKQVWKAKAQAAEATIRRLEAEGAGYRDAADSFESEVAGLTERAEQAEAENVALREALTRAEDQRKNAIHLTKLAQRGEEFWRTEQEKAVEACELALARETALRGGCARIASNLTGLLACEVPERYPAAMETLAEQLYALSGGATQTDIKAIVDDWWRGRAGTAEELLRESEARETALRGALSTGALLNAADRDRVLKALDFYIGELDHQQETMQMIVLRDQLRAGAARAAPAPATPSHDFTQAEYDAGCDPRHDQHDGQTLRCVHGEPVERCDAHCEARQLRQGAGTEGE